jgi:hypothetical protein
LASRERNNNVMDLRIIKAYCILTSLLALICSPGLSAEIYISKGPNGEKLISDRPPHRTKDFSSVMKRDSIRNAGHILANRFIEGSGPNRFQSHINGASTKFNLDPALVEAVIQVESGFNPNAVSKKGATGLMQLMLPTALQYDVYDRFNPRQNIYAGTQHLSKLVRRFDGEITLALAAYNAGSTAVLRYQGVPPYPETERYITKVMTYRQKYRRSRYGESTQ